MTRNGGNREPISAQKAAWHGRSLVTPSGARREFERLGSAAAECGLDFAKFPSTRYQGSKRKIIPWLWEHLRGLDFQSALDVFGGTASVSYLFKMMGKATTYNDYLRFNQEIARGLIENDFVVLSQDDIEAACDPPKSSRSCFIQKTFKGLYFTDDENAWIDRVVGHIESLSESPYKQALLRYALIQSCLVKRPFNLFHRRNLYLRFAKTKRQFGNKTTWDRPFGEVFAAFCFEANSFVFKGEKKCHALCHDALKIPPKDYDLVYIDPPYLRADRFNETYLSYYHFLEGLCRYSEWKTLVDHETINLRMKVSGIDPWSDPRMRIKLLDELFDSFRSSILVLSYKRFGVPSIETLIRMLKRHGKTVCSHSRHYKYALNHQNGSAALNREMLLVAE